MVGVGGVGTSGDPTHRPDGVTALSTSVFEYLPPPLPLLRQQFGEESMPSKCRQDGCTKQSRYGGPGSKKREFCSEHKTHGMVDVVSKRCLHHGCTKQPSYGVEGTNKKEFCAQHKRGGMVDLKIKRCLHQGCTKGASYGVHGSNKMEFFCVRHATPGMAGTKSRRPSVESQDSPANGRARGDSGEGPALTRRATVGDKRKRRAPPAPLSMPSSYGARIQEAGKRARRVRTIPAVVVLVKEEAAAAAATAAAAAAVAAAVPNSTFSPIALTACQNSTERTASSSFDSGDRVKAEVAVS